MTDLGINLLKLTPPSPLLISLSCKMSDVSARSMKVKVRCPGKVILFGEHASVYGYPSLVTTVSAYTQVSKTNKYCSCFFLYDLAYIFTINFVFFDL